MSDDHANRQVHEAIGLLLNDDEFAMSWTLTIDVAGPDDARYLLHRAGGGADGTNLPTMWAALGMLRASVLVAERQLRESTGAEGDEDNEDKDV